MWSTGSNSCWTPTVCKVLHLVMGRTQKYEVLGLHLEGASARTQRGSEITTKAGFVFKEYEIEMGWETCTEIIATRGHVSGHKMSASNEDHKILANRLHLTITRSTEVLSHSEKDSEAAKGSAGKSADSIRNVCHRVPGGAHFHRYSHIHHACFRRIYHVQLQWWRDASWHKDKDLPQLQPKFEKNRYVPHTAVVTQNYCVTIWITLDIHEYMLLQTFMILPSTKSHKNIQEQKKWTPWGICLDRGCLSKQTGETCSLSPTALDPSWASIRMATNSF